MWGLKVTCVETEGDVCGALKVTCVGTEGDVCGDRR